MTELTRLEQIKQLERLEHILEKNQANEIWALNIFLNDEKTVKKFDPEELANTLRHINDLAQSSISNGEHDGVEDLLKRALMIQQNRPELTPIRVTTLFTLAKLYEVQGRYQEACKYYERAVFVVENVVPHSFLITLLIALANTYERLNLLVKAEAVLLRALGYSNILNVPPEKVTIILGDISSVYIDLKLMEKAKIYNQLALDSAGIEKDSNKLLLAQCLCLKAGFLRLGGQHIEAVPLLDQALAIRKETPGHNQDLVAQTHINLVVLYLDMDRYSEAKFNYEEAIAILENYQISNTGNLASIKKENLASIKKQLERLYKRLYELYEQLYSK